ncbi:FkbM family methyltransferase [Chloroflexia bacterium SDU3-3]|nr:FkbM family methyltransferase [Chloroflexia bacterium SDU3-3]
MSAHEPILSRLRAHPFVADVSLAKADGTEQLVVVPKLAHAPVVADHERVQLSDTLAVITDNRREALSQYSEFFESPFLGPLTILPGDVVVDIGANIGMFSLYAQQHGARVYAVEPAPQTSRLLQLNIDMHQQASAPTAHVVEAGVGEENGTALFSYNQWSPAGSGFYSQEAQQHFIAAAKARIQKIRSQIPPSETQQSELLARYEQQIEQSTAVFSHTEVPIYTLHHLMSAYQIGHIDLLKVDAEGLELPILRQLDERDWASIYQLLVEVHDGGSYEPILTLLANHGFDTSASTTDDRGEGTYQIYAFQPGRAKQIAPAQSQTLAPVQLLTAEALMPLLGTGEAHHLVIADPVSGLATAADHDLSLREGRLRKLEAIFRELLGPEHIHEDFLQHGRSANQLFFLALRVYQELQILLPLPYLMEGPYTIRAIEQVIQRMDHASAS